MDPVHFCLLLQQSSGKVTKQRPRTALPFRPQRKTMNQLTTLRLGAFLILSAAAGAWSAASGAPARLGPAVPLSVTSAHLAPRDAARADRRIAIRDAGGSGGAGAPAVSTAGNATYGILHAEFKDAASCSALNVPGATVFNRFDRWADIWYPAENTEAQKGVASAPGIVWVEIGHRCSVPPPPAAKEARGRGVPESIV